MPKIIKFLRKFLAALFLVLGTIVVATGVYCYHYQEQIIQKFLEEANKRVKNPIQISSVQLTALKTFPHIGVILQEVVVKDHTKSAADLMTAREIYCVFDVWKLIHGQYLVRYLSLAHGKLCLGPDLAHQLGWEVDERAVMQQAAPLTVSLDKLELKDMEIVYGGKPYHYAINAEQMQARLKWVHTRLEADLQGQANIRDIQLKDLAFAQNIPVALRAALSYEQQNQTWTLGPMQFKHSSSLLAVQGSGSLGEASPIALRIQGEKISPQLLFRCLPKQYSQQIQPYDLRGRLSLDLSINKQRGRALALQGDFVLCNGALTVSQLAKPIALNKLAGRLHIPDVQDLKKATLSVHEIASTLAQSKLAGNFTLSDFHNLHLQCAAEATVDLASLSTLLANAALTDASGKLEVRWKLATNLRQLTRGIHAKDNLQLSGALHAQSVQFKLGSDQLLCKELIGSLVFQENGLVIKDFSGTIGPGSFVLNGTVQNLLPYWLSNDQKLYAATQLYVDYLDLGSLLPAKHKADEHGSTTPKFNIPSQWVLNLACDIQQLHFRRFQGQNVRAQLSIKDQKLIAEKLQLGVAGGKAFVDGVLDTTTDHLNLHTAAKLKGVQLATLFYIFDNFHQNFLMDKHLGGEVFADVDLKMQADKHWNIYWDALQADINARLSNGALYQFEPIQQLAKYVAEESLAQLRFSELKNHIRIKDKTIHIPPMEVHSNVTRIQLSGKHTFDGQVDYNLVVPFTSYQQQKEGATEEVATDALAGINLFLKLQGDVDNYKIRYDIKALRYSLKGKLQEQGKVLRDLLQGKYQGKTQLKELAPDDYLELD